ncbi:hypothetical protein CG006_00780 [Mesoplasma florum]|uniref:hypothetical protein n=1 Tax=Mesoplasma florum TaxID=2151 RepID=UPI000D03D2EC|nr:hypothetical protein [Mesoplasma florum]AVN63527.1 hypothetical protein CG006_00780 [Mesoplasma florum]
MKKILLSLSALTIGATPAVSLLNVGQKQVITQVTSEIQKKIDETSVLFKAPIITNAQKQNSDVTTNWLNDQKVSDISNIDSALSYADFNAEKYDIKSAEKTLNKIYKDKDYKYKNEDATSELIFGAADKGVSLLENSIDDDGLKVDSVNEFLNWISYVSFASGGSLKADKFDSSILKFADKISFVKMFKHYPAPTYTQLKNEGVETYRGLKFYTLSNFNSFMSINYGLTNETGAWNFKIQDTDAIARNFFNASSAMYKEIFSKDDQKVSKHEFKFTSDSVVYLLNFIYSLSYYIDAFNQPEYIPDPSIVTDQNHLFSPYKTNIEIMNEIYNKNISKENIDKRSLNGILSIFYDIMYKGSDSNGYRSSRVLKILFQVDDDITDGNTKMDLNQKVLKANKSLIVSVNVGEWKNNTTGPNGIFNIFFASLAKGFLDNQVSGTIGALLSLLGLSTENLGSIIAGVISSILSGIDMNHFFATLSSQLNTTLKNVYSWGLFGLIGKQIKGPLEEQLTNMGFGTDNSPNKKPTGNFKNKPTDDFIDYLDQMIQKFSNINVSENSPETWSLFNNLFNQIINEKGRLQSILKLFNVNLPIDMSNKSVKDIFRINVLGISIGDVLTLILKGFDSSLPLFYKILGLLATVTSSDISNEYDFFIKGQEEPLSSINEVLGYTPTDDRTSDLAVIWSMMKFVKDDNGKNKVLGIRPKNSNNTEEEKIWGHKAWKYLLGLNYDDKSYNQDSILFYVNELLTNGLTAKIIQWPVKMTRKYIDYNLSDITFNRNKKMNYWSNKDLFSTQFVSYQEDSKQEVLNYKIMYKVKKDVYYTYNVSVYKENTSSKFKINSFNRI